MKSSGEIEANIGTHFTLSDWEQEDPCSLWRSPSSPPYSEPISINQRSSADQSSSPSTPSEFEFDSLATPDQIRDELPVSPKFLSSFAWAAMASASQEDCSASTSISPLRRDMVVAPSSMTDTPLSLSKKQPYTPPSPSVRQLITEEMHGSGEHDESDLDFYSAPQTPAPCSRPLSPNHRPFSLDYQPLANLDKQLGSHDVLPMMEQRKSRSAGVLDRRNVALYPGLTTTAMKGLTPSKSQPHANFIEATSSSALHTWDKSEEDKNYTGAKKAGSSKSFKWAFKDFLRRTVPSSKVDAHYTTKTLEATSSSRSFFSHSRSTPISPQSSPLRSYIDSTSRPPTLQAGRPSSHTPRSPPHRPPFTQAGRSHSTLDTQSDANKSQYASTPSRTPVPSPPRSPLSPHVAHYKLQKAQSQELGRKTFLPYRQSLLGCLGGYGAFSSDQLVW
ncbi:hypothetical protein GOP47_0004510 [Adiantum capillus-veneris]|uniref:Uncharacterized protein n=1 Tax=Adiantum capillus-veneris TaxID=13818 RepID=A0A9D4V9E5_ADICA|nr:hypothetical protein GOP47_0004510 [Adiantum capillus-veneris]